jgi:nitrous oxide reductase
MNKDLKSRVFNVPQDILDKINHTIVGLNGQNVRGIQRAKKILQDKTVKYGQLKRIIHDIQNIDKIKDKLKYDLCGGDLMERWSKQHLQGERDLVSNRKDSKKRADDISSMTGERKNSHLKKHTKNFNFRIPTNLIKSNSDKSSISPITSLGLFEEVDKIKKLIKY